MTLRELYNKADYKDELGMCFKGDKILDLETFALYADVYKYDIV